MDKINLDIYGTPDPFAFKAPPAKNTYTVDEYRRGVSEGSSLTGFKTSMGFDIYDNEIRKAPPMSDSVSDAISSILKYEKQRAALIPNLTNTTRVGRIEELEDPPIPEFQEREIAKYMALSGRSRDECLDVARELRKMQSVGVGVMDKLKLKELPLTCGSTNAMRVGGLEEQKAPPTLKRAVLIGTEDGSECRRDGCVGVIGFYHDCQCSVSRAPCWQCENAKLTCTMCDWEEPDYVTPPANNMLTRDNKPDDRRPFKRFRDPSFRRVRAKMMLSLYRHKHFVWPAVVADRAADKVESNRDARPWYDRI